MARRLFAPSQGVAITSRDTLLYRDMEIDVSVLDAIVNCEARVLWAFLKKDGQVQPVPFDEEKVIWLQESDLRAECDIEV